MRRAMDWPMHRAPQNHLLPPQRMDKWAKPSTARAVSLQNFSWSYFYIELELAEWDIWHGECPSSEKECFEGGLYFLALTHGPTCHPPAQS
jgi:hypothetical protein